MIEVEQAIELIETHASASETERSDIKKALGYVSMQNVLSPINMPPFNQSAMDGYAIHFDDSISSYLIIGEIPAGKNPSQIKLKKGEAARIFTGAEIPVGCSSVIQQEWCTQKKNILTFNKEIKNNLNIRPIGEEVKESEIVIQKGSQLNAATIGFLASLGISSIEVNKKPKIGIVITGSELINLDDKWAPGKIYESNSYLLESILNTFGHYSVSIYKAKDSFDATKTAAKNAIQENDVVLFSGGISVGDYDHVYNVLKELNVETIFYKVKQKPGKPLYFGKVGSKAIFGLPGNPGSALTCFYIYVLRYLSIYRNVEYPIKKKTIRLQSNYRKKAGRSEFIKAIVKGDKAEVCDFQNSSMLRAFVEGNGLIYMNDKIENPKQGDRFDCYLLL